MVDDEESARNILHNLLLRFCPEVELIASFTNVPDAVHAIKEHQPDLVFLDIEMPNYAGYEIVDFFEKVNFEIIFITAYDKYAIKAFEVSAVDYLLKPIEIDRLKESVSRITAKLYKDQSVLRIDHLKKTLKENEIKSLVITQNSYQYVVALTDVIAIEAQESYSCIHTKEKRYLASKNLKHFEKLLVENNNFHRVHKSWIINQDFMVNYSKSTLQINLQSGLVAKLSKYKKADFEASL